MAITKKLPGYPAYVRIEKILRSEAIHANRLTAPSFPVLRTGGRTELVPPEVAAVVTHLGRKGFQPGEASRDTVIAAATVVFATDYAKVYLSGDDAPPAVPSLPAKAAPKAAPKAKAKIAKPTPAKVEPPAAKAKTEPKPDNADDKIVPPKVEAKAPAAPAPEKTVVAAGAATTPKRDGDSLYAPFLGVISLLMGAEQILNAHDRLPGHERRAGSISEFIRECQNCARATAR